MEIDQLQPLPVIDCHIHYPHPRLMPELLEVCDQLKIDRFNVVCTPDQMRLSLVPEALHLKAHDPHRVFVFGGLDVSTYFRDPQHVGDRFAEYVDVLSQLGCDGIKMIEAKPQMRKMLPVPPFNSQAFEPYWEKLEKTQFPLLMHVNDPEAFWDKDKAPKWAFERGWFYGDGSYINNEQQYQEIFDVLQRHPKLKVILDHFFFMSAQLPRLADLLERYPNVNIDLTPGIEMYFNFNKDLQAARDFFVKYQDRILFGTDIGARALLVNPDLGIQMPESRGRVCVVRNFLENQGGFLLDTRGGFLFGEENVPLHGLGLSKEILEKIYFRNFERIVSAAPQMVNPQKAIEFCDQIETLIDIQGSSQPGVPGDKSVARMVGDYFRSLS